MAITEWWITCPNKLCLLCSCIAVSSSVSNANPANQQVVYCPGTKNEAVLH